MKKIVALLLAIVFVFALASCTGNAEGGEKKSKTFKIGICNYVDDASLNQIVDNIKNQLKAKGDELDVEFKINYDNCNADSNVLAQIIANFQAENVDLMVAIATPVAIPMQTATEDSGTPVIFAAVSDPIGAGLVESLEKPGANITGTSDYLDTAAIFKLIKAQNPEIKKIGLLYDIGQDSSKAPIEDARKLLDEAGIEYVEKTGRTVDEISLAADTLIAEGVEAIFTPTDNTVMQAELSIYEKLAENNIPHYCGADSFALNGSFLGYGVDYANLGKETANMIVDVLVNGRNPAELSVRTFDNGTATVNTEICEKLGIDIEKIKETFAPFCTKVETIKTAESFDEAK